jgi:hypothetical protein
MKGWFFMKKLICFILILMLTLSFSSCFDYNNKTTANTKKTFTSVQPSEEYFTFEKACQSADRIIIGKFIDYAPSIGDYWVLEFEVIDTIFGEETNTAKIYLHGTKNTYTDKKTNKSYKFSPKEAGFYRQCTYIIPLKIVDDVYQDYPYAYPIGSALVDINDISQSQMYGKYIQQHTTGIDFSQSTVEDVVEYVRELSVNNTISKKPLSTDNLKEIIGSSEKIVHVRVEEFEKRNDSTFFDIEFYKCTVVENLKGKYDKDSEISIVFFSETVNVGEEYIVMLAEGGSSIMQRFSAKQSLRSVSEKETIKNILANNS